MHRNGASIPQLTCHPDDLMAFVDVLNIPDLTMSAWEQVSLK